MITRELRVFLIVGSLTVLLDFLTYRALVLTDCLSVDIAKSLGFLAGTLFAYYANKAWTFGQNTHTPGGAWRFVLLYAITLTTNVMVNAGCLALFSAMPIAIQSSFLIATFVSAALNFLGLKFFVFKTHPFSEKS